MALTNVRLVVKPRRKVLEVTVSLVELRMNQVDEESYFIKVLVTDLQTWRLVIVKLLL